MIRVEKHQAFFILLWTASLIVAWRPLAGTFALSLRDDGYTHILLILPISAALIILERRSFTKLVSPGIHTSWAMLALAIFSACFIFAPTASVSPDVQLSIRILALVLFWIGAFTLCFGTRASRSVSFPLLFLFGLVPLPRQLLDIFVSLLQQMSACAAHFLFSICGVPVSQDGVAVSIPGLTVHVAEECSSIRSSSMLLVTTIVLAYLLLRSPWRRAVVVGLALPLSIFKNGLRIFTIAMLGTRVDPAYLTGRLHHDGGIVFFAIVMLIIFAILWIFRRAENRWPNAALKPALSNATGA